MKTKSLFKETEIGNIPKDWTVVSLGDDASCELIMGQSPPSSSYNDESKGLPFFQGNADFGETYPQPKTYTTNPIKISLKKDVLISVRAPVGEVNLSPTKCCIGRGLGAIRTNPEKIYFLFVFYSMKFNASKLHSLSSGSTFKAITKSDLENFVIALPSLTEQQKIADVLLTADTAISTSKKIIHKTEQIRNGLIHELLSKGIGHTTFETTEIGDIPKGWDVKELEKVINEAKSGFASGKRDENGITQFRMNNISTDGKIVLDKTLKIPVPENIDDYLIKPNDVLFNNTNSVDLIGKSAIFNGEIDRVTYSNHITRIRVDKNKILPEWVLYNLIRKWHLGFFRSVCVRHVGQAGVRNSDLLSLQIPIPPLKEQQKIIEILSTINSKLDSEIKRRNHFTSIKQGLMNDLLTGKKRLN